MINLHTIDDNTLNQTMRLIKREAIRRQWSAHLLAPTSSHIYFTRSDGSKIHTFGVVPPTTSAAADRVSKNKNLCYKIMCETNIPQLETILIANDDIQPGLDFLNLHESIVVKPFDGAHGDGITTNVKNKHALESAIDYALSFSNPHKSVLVQRQYPHERLYDLRILCIDYRFVAAIYRTPAAVIGDGIRTNRELIVAENNSTNRGVAYKSKLAVINIDSAEMHLGKRMNEVPKVGEVIEVLGIANYGAGGETIDVTDKIPEWLKRLAEHAADTLELPMAGIDFISCIPPEATTTNEQMDVVFIEANKAPSLAIHVQPTHGLSRDVVRDYFDYLETINA